MKNIFILLYRALHALMYRASHIGTSSSQDDYINRKTVICNQIVWIQSVITSLNLYGLYLFLPSWFEVMVVFLIGNVITLLFSYFGLSLPARIFLCLISTLVNVTLDGTSVPVGHELNAVTHINFVIALTYPFLLFGRREVFFMVGLILMNTLLYLGLPFYIDLIPKLLTEKQMQYLHANSYATYFIALITYYVVLYINLRDSDKATHELSKLHQKTTKQNKHLRNSQQELSETLETLKKKQESENQQNQISTWLIGLNNILNYRRNTVDKMYHELVLHIVDVLEVNQLGLYCVNQSQPSDIRIELVNSYSYESNRLSQSIKVGEGLLGQAYINKEKIILTDIPENYTTISSGLGSATPKYLIITPLIVHDNIEGFIEVTSFHVLKDFEVQFLERASKSIATFMASERAQKHVKKLLEQSEEQTKLLYDNEQKMKDQLEQQQKIQEELTQKQAESESLLERFDLIGKSSVAGFWDVKIPKDLGNISPNTNLNWSERFRKIIGYTEEELSSSVGSWNSILHPDDREQDMIDTMTHLMDVSGRTPYDFEYRLRHKDGHYIWVRTTGNTLRNERGEPIRMAGSLINIQPIKDMEIIQKQLKQERARYEHLFEYSNIPIVIINQEYKYVDANQALLKLFGHTIDKEELYASNIGDYSAPYQANGKSSKEMVIYYINQAYELGSVSFEWIFRKKDGSLFSANTFFYLYDIEDGRYIQALIHPID